MTLNTFFTFFKKIEINFRVFYSQGKYLHSKIRFTKKLKDKNSSFIYVFDVSTSSTGYGDFLHLFFSKIHLIKKEN